MVPSNVTEVIDPVAALVPPAPADPSAVVSQVPVDDATDRGSGRRSADAHRRLRRRDTRQERRNCAALLLAFQPLRQLEFLRTNPDDEHLCDDAEVAVTKTSR